MRQQNLLLLFVAAILSCALFSFSFFAQAERIVDYEIDWVKSNTVISGDGPDGWAYYDTNFRTGASVATDSIRDDSIKNTPLNICPPFYTRERVRLFIDSNGFLSLQPFSMCGLFCHSSHRDYGEMGYYAFSGSSSLRDPSPSSSSGGDWPLIAGYLYDLDPTSFTASIYKRDFVNMSMVEYYNVPDFYLFGNSGNVNMQIQVYQNGTIVMRLATVLGGQFPKIDPPIPVTGLLLSKNLRKDVGKVTNNNITSWRFRPVYDPCQQFDGTNCSHCTGQGILDKCTWCAGPKICTTLNAIDSVCIARSDTFLSLEQCGNYSAAGFVSDVSKYDQVFYNVSLQSRGTQTIGAASLHNVDFNSYSSGAKISASLATNKSAFPAEFELPFNLSFFNFPVYPLAAVDNGPRWSTKKLTVFASGLVKFGSIAGAGGSVASGAVPTSNGGTATGFAFPFDCDSSRGYCFQDNFPPSVAPFVSFNLGFDKNAGSAEYIEIPERSPATTTSAAGNSPFCDEYLASTNPSMNGKCAQAIGIELRHLVFTEQQGASLPSNRRRESSILVNVTTRVFIDAVGNVGVWIGRVASEDVPVGNCPDADGTASMGGWVYKTATVGLIRHGVSDWSSLSAPYQAIYENSVFFYSPIKGCPSCNSNGGCNTTTNTCQCKPSFAGASCSACAPGFYGRFCDQCPTCQNGGTCDDGRSGSGSCVCTGRWSGEFCEVLCESEAAARCNDPPCSLFGGICTCGKCACRTENGWYDPPRCDKWRDPCDEFSLAGCGTCEANRNTKTNTTILRNQCFYCEDPRNNRCMSNSSTRRRINTTLLQSCGDPSLSGSSCAAVTYPVRTDFDFNGTLGIIAFVLLTILTAVGLVALLFCRGSVPNPYITNAVNGIPDFRRPPREREVIQIRVVDPRRVGLLQGIPLRTVSMLELYRFQKARRAGTPMEPPGSEHIAEAIARAEQMSRAFANAGPLPQGGGGNGGGNGGGGRGGRRGGGAANSSTALGSTTSDSNAPSPTVTNAAASSGGGGTRGGGGAGSGGTETTIHSRHTPQER